MRYRALRTADLDLPFQRDMVDNLRAQVATLHGVDAALVRTASAASRQVALYKAAADEATRAQRAADDRAAAAAERRWWEHPGLWVGVGVAGTIGAVWALGQVLHVNVALSRASTP